MATPDICAVHCSMSRKFGQYMFVVSECWFALIFDSAIGMSRLQSSITTQTAYGSVTTVK